MLCETGLLIRFQSKSDRHGGKDLPARMHIGGHCTARESASLSNPPATSIPPGRNEDREQNDKGRCRRSHGRLRDKRLENGTNDAMVRNAKFVSECVAEK
jgi:hypothetical protein